MRQSRGEGQLAQALGWFSIALGTAELVAPGRLARLIGVRKRPLLMRFLGLREIASGIGILAQRDRPAAWLWSRVAGDVMDMGLLAAALSDRGSRRNRLAAAVAAVAGVAALDLVSSQRTSRPLLTA